MMLNWKYLSCQTTCLGVLEEKNEKNIDKYLFVGDNY